MNDLFVNGRHIKHYQICAPHGSVSNGVRGLPETPATVDEYEDSEKKIFIQSWAFETNNMVIGENTITIEGAIPLYENKEKLL